MDTFDSYQAFTRTTAVYPEVGTGQLAALSYLTLGIAGEAGEVAEKVKKLFRDGDSPEKRELLQRELGDVMWYVARLADEMGVSLSTVIAQNVEKLESRQTRGALHGNGDKR